jgi:hypothetical protein
MVELRHPTTAFERIQRGVGSGFRKVMLRGDVFQKSWPRVYVAGRLMQKSKCKSQFTR